MSGTDHDIRPARQRGFALAIKRVIDAVAALVLLLLAGPVMLLIAVAIRLDSPGPALFRQERIGWRGRPFTVLKFRSMRVDADPAVHRDHVRRLMAGETSDPGGTFKLRADARITRLGRFLRRTSLDELPQLLNVLRGEMSLVGPRPDLRYVTECYEPWQWRRFEVLPGMTGLWQVSGRDHLSPADMLRLDVEYARRWSLRLDVSILLRTVPALIHKLRRQPEGEPTPPSRRGHAHDAVPESPPPEESTRGSMSWS